MAREELESLENFDVTIVGGGIVGAGLLREQSMHNVKSLLLDQADFNSQTSQSSSKMLHGGIRYLENMDFALVFEALREKNLWLKITPHLTKELPFFLPVYKDSKWPLFFMRIGLFLYDLLSLFQNTPHKVFSKKDALKQIPGIKEKGLTGCGMYFDGIVDDSKLGLECIYDALTSEKSKALNYKKVVAVNKSSDDRYIVNYQDVFSKEVTQVVTKHIIFATGPFTDQVLNKLNIEWTPKVLPSKGSHIWLNEDSLPITKPMVIQTRDQRIIFVIPQNKMILIGTTEIPISASSEMLNIKPSRDEIDYILNAVNEYFPNAKLTESNIISSYSGVRPLVKSSESSSKTSRHHKIFEPQKNMHVIVGGKYTTFRVMAQELNKIIFKRLNVKLDKELSKLPMRKQSVIVSGLTEEITIDKINQILRDELVKTKDDLINRRLSIPNIDQIESPEIKSYIKELNLESIR